MACAKKAKKTVANKTYGWGAMMSISVNYVVGSGMLALPSVTAGSSIFISLCLVTLATIMTIVPAISMGDVIARGYALRKAKQTYNDRRKASRQRRARPATPDKSSGTEKPGTAETSPQVELQPVQQSGTSTPAIEPSFGEASSTQMLVIPETSLKVAAPADPLAPHYYIPNDEDFVVSELMRIVFGEAGFYFYQIFLILFLLSVLWSYGNVVSSSLASIIPFPGLPAYRSSGHTSWVCAGPCQPHYYLYCYQAYFIWLVITFVFSQIMVFFDLSEQKVMQTIFTYCRFLVLILVVVIGAIALGVSPFDPPSQRSDPPYSWPGFAYLFFEASAVGNLFSLIIFAFIFHYAIPSLIKPLKQSDHHRLTSVFVIVLGVIFAIVLMIMYIDGSFFGANSASLVSLNFVLWDGVFWHDVSGPKPWWSTLVSYVVRILPPFYILSAVPINALVIAENMRALFAQRFQKTKWVFALTRILSVLPAMILAGALRCLSVILNYAGIIAYLVILAPMMLAHVARQQCKTIFGQRYEVTAYTNFTSLPVVAWSFYFLLCVSFSITLYSLIVP